MFVEQRPSGAWRGGYRANGRKVSQTFPYEWQAREWAEAGEAAAAAPELAPAAPVMDTPTVDAHGADWLARKGSRARSTRDGYACHLRAITATGMGARPMGTVLPRDVEAWQTEQVEAGVGIPTVNARLKVLRMVYRDAVRNGVTPTDATMDVALLPEPIGQDAGLTMDAVDALADAAPTPQIRALILLCADAGLRFQEAAGLPASAVVGDFIVIRQVLERSTGQVRAWPKGKRERKVPIATTRLAEALAPLVAAADDWDSLLVTTDNGAPLLYDNFRHRVWPQTKRAAGVKMRKGHGIHQLRHYTGTTMANAGVARHEIAEFLGHADEKTTRRYIHAGEDGRRLALAREALNRKPAAPRLTAVS